MKIKKIAAVLLCVTTMASMPYIPALSDTIESVSITAEAADTRIGTIWSNLVLYTIYETSSGSRYAAATDSNVNITDVVIPATVTYSGVSYPIKKISSRAFDSNKKLRTVDLSTAYNLTEISGNAFINSTVTNVYIGNSLTIKDNAFYNTPNLSYVNLQARAKKVTICSNAFKNSGLTKLNCSSPEIVIKDNAFDNYHTQNLQSVYFGSNVKTITLGNSVFYGLSSLKTFTIENTSATLNLGTYVFAYSAVNTVKLPSTLTSIPNGTFYTCGALKSITIPAAVTTIGDSAFAWSGLSGTLTLSAKVTSINETAFTSLWDLTAFSVSASNTNYKSESGVLYSKNGSTLLSYPGKKTATSFTTTASRIPDHAFSHNKYLKSLSIANYYPTQAQSQALFEGLDNLEELIIPRAHYLDSAENIMSRYYILFEDTKLHTINNVPIVQTLSSGEPVFNSKFSSYMNEHFENHAYNYFMKQYVNKMAAYVVKCEVTDQMTDMEKAVKLHEWILDRVTYDPREAEWCDQVEAGMTPDSSLKTEKNHVDASVFLHKRDGKYYTVCDGYARCYKLLLNAAGVEAYYVHGKDTTFDPNTGDKKMPINHAWNLVKINGNYYHVDACWDDGNDAGAYKYNYFMKSDVQFNGDGHSTYEWKAEEDPLGYLNEQNSNSNITYGYLGDVKYNEQVRGLVDSNDVTYLQSLVNAVAIPARERAYGDMDFDGDLDNNDVSMLKEYLSKYKKSYGSAWKWRLSSLENVQQLSDVCVANGATAKTTIVSDNNIVKYEWYYKNANMSSFEKTSTFTGKTYSVTMNSTRSGRQIYCVLTDDKGNTFQTNIVTLSMK